MLFLCYPKCSTCQKAKTFLEKSGVAFEWRDIKENNPSYEELKDWFALSKLPIKKFFNTSSLVYKSLNLKDKLPSMNEEECLKLLASEGMLVKRPLLVTPKTVLTGFKQSEWEEELLS